LKEIKQIQNSEWALMTTRDDYIDINKMLEKYADDFGIQLKDPLWK